MSEDQSMCEDCSAMGAAPYESGNRPDVINLCAPCTARHVRRGEVLWPAGTPPPAWVRKARES